MQNREVEPFPKQNYEFTATANHVAGEMVCEALASGEVRFGRVVDTVASGSIGMMSCLGVFECDKETTADTWSDRRKLEAVVDGTTKQFTLQVHDKGICVGRSIGASIGTDTFTKFELIPELN
jgi:hypothetical protein